MKIMQMFAAAGLVVASLGAATTADAQSWRGDRYGNYDRGYRGDYGRDYDRGYRDWRGDRGRHYGWDRGRRHGWNGYRGGGRQRCWTEYRYNHRVRVCR